MRHDDDASRRLRAHWTAIVPVKAGPPAKSRLSDIEGLGLPDRSELIRAFATDVVDALIRTPGVDRVIVVANDPTRVAHLAALGATVIQEAAAQSGSHDALNSAVRQGADAARDLDTATHLVAVQGDLPALRPEALAEVLEMAVRVPRAMVVDAEGTGTTLLFATAPGQLNPLLGAGSRVAHEAAGHVVLDAPASLRRDVDTLPDLREAIRIGVGPATSTATAVLGDRR